MQNQRFTGLNREIRETRAGTEYILYGTPVVIVSRCGRSVTLNSGGFMTATTKNAMNQASNEYGLNFSVYQAGGGVVRYHWRATRRRTASAFF